MKVVVVSDSHQEQKVLMQIVKDYNADYYLHAGDSCLSEAMIEPFISVRGNCDYFPYPEKRILEFGILRIFMTHGHLSSLSSLMNIAKKNNCNIVIFGHTHQPFWQKIDNINIINPGSVSFPRNNSKKTFVIIKTNEMEEIDISFIEL